jgi:hypothetical protein
MRFLEQSLELLSAEQNLYFVFSSTRKPKNFENIGAHTGITDQISEAFRQKYSFHDTVPCKIFNDDVRTGLLL